MKRSGSNDHTDAQRGLQKAHFCFCLSWQKGYLIAMKTKSWKEFALEAIRLFAGVQQDS